MKIKCYRCNVENDFKRTGTVFYCSICGLQLAYLLHVKIIEVLSSEISVEIRSCLADRKCLAVPLENEFLHKLENDDDVSDYSEIILPWEFVRDMITDRVEDGSVLQLVDFLIASKNEGIRLKTGEFELIEEVALYDSKHFLGAKIN